jgi:hypothetical protein
MCLHTATGEGVPGGTDQEANEGALGGNAAREVNCQGRGKSGGSLPRTNAPAAAESDARLVGKAAKAAPTEAGAGNGTWCSSSL